MEYEILASGHPQFRELAAHAAYLPHYCCLRLSRKGWRQKFYFPAGVDLGAVEDLTETEAERYWQGYVEYLPAEVLADFEATN